MHKIALGIATLLLATVAACSSGDEEQERADDPPVARATATVAVTSVATSTAVPSSDADAARRAEGGDRRSTSGDLPSGLDPVERVSSAAARTADLQSYQFSLGIALTGVPELPEGASIGARGAVDGASERIQMVIDLGPLFEAATASGADPALRDAVAVFGGEMEFIQDGSTSYVRWPMLSALFGVATEWVSFTDESARMNVLGSLSGELEGFGQISSSPDDLLELLGETGTVREIGAEKVGGESATHYVGVLDIDALIATASPEERAELQAQLAAAGVESLNRLPVDLWIDADGIVRRWTMELDLSRDPAAEGSMTLTYEVFGMDEAIRIPIPAGSEVTDLSLLLSSSFSE